MKNDGTIRGRYNKIIGYVIPLAPSACPTHKPHKLTMVAWYADCERRRKAGEKQTQCKKCGRWYWPDEF